MPCGERAAVSVADVLRDHLAGLRLSPEQAKAAAHILACRTGRLGGHLAFCDRCGYKHFAYHSCRDRHCPRCGSLDQALWAEAQIQHLLPISYFHLGFTIPASLRPFFLGPDRANAFEALFSASSETILEVAVRRGLRPGVLAVLHTWTQQLDGHPHTHCLVPGGGLGKDGFIHRCRYLFPIKVLRHVFKIKLLQRLRQLLREGKLSVARYAGYQLLRDADSRTWNVDVRRPLAGPLQVIRYFARYTRRIALSDRRLLSYDGRTVAFRYRDRKDGNRVKVKKLDAETFCRRFLSHVLPHRFVRIRRYGILSNRVRGPLLQKCRDLLDAKAPLPPKQESRSAACFRIFGVDPEICPKCKNGRLVVRSTWRHPTPHRRRPRHLGPEGPLSALLSLPRGDGQHPLAQHAPEVRPFFLGYRPRRVVRATSGPRAQRRVPQHGTTAALLPREAASQRHGAHHARLRMHQPPNIRG